MFDKMSNCFFIYIEKKTMFDKLSNIVLKNLKIYLYKKWKTMFDKMSNCFFIYREMSNIVLLNFKIYLYKLNGKQCLTKCQTVFLYI